MSKKSLAIASLVLLSIIAMRILIYNSTSSVNRESDTTSLLIIETSLSSRELRELIIHLNGETVTSCQVV